MSHQPPVPAGNQSPYPLHEAPHPQNGAPPAGAAVATTSEAAVKPAKKPKDDHAPAVSRGVVGALAAVGVAAFAAAGAWALTSRSGAARRKRKGKRAKR